MAGLEYVGDILTENLLAPTAGIDGAFKKGLQGSMQGMKVAGGGLTALAGKALHSPAIRDYGLGAVAKAQQAAAESTMRVEDIKDVGSAVDFVKYAAGYTIPQVILAALGGTAGRAAGGALARGSSPAALLAGKNAGTIAGLGLSSIGQEVGSIYPEALQTGVANPEARAIGGGMLAGALDFLPQVYLAKKLGFLGKATGAKGGVLAEAAKTAAKSAAMEGPLTEFPQTIIERAAAGKPLEDAEAISEYLNATVLGSLGGGMVGGVVGGVNAAFPQQGKPLPEELKNIEQQVAGPTPIPTSALPPAPAAPALAQPLGENLEPALPELNDLPYRVGQMPTAELADPFSDIRLQAADAAMAANPHREVARVLADQRAALDGRLAALTAELSLPEGQRRSKQEISREQKALKAQIPELDRNISSQKILADTPVYRAKGELTPEGAPLWVDPARSPSLVGQPGFTRTAEQVLTDNRTPSPIITPDAPAATPLPELVIPTAHTGGKVRPVDPGVTPKTRITEGKVLRFGETETPTAPTQALAIPGSPEVSVPGGPILLPDEVSTMFGRSAEEKIAGDRRAAALTAPDPTTPGGPIIIPPAGPTRVKARVNYDPTNEDRLAWTAEDRVPTPAVSVPQLALELKYAQRGEKAPDPQVWANSALSAVSNVAGRLGIKLTPGLSKKLSAAVNDSATSPNPVEEFRSHFGASLASKAQHNPMRDLVNEISQELSPGEVFHSFAGVAGTIDLVHYSPAKGLTRTDTKRAGKGIPGAERRRLDAFPEDAVRERTYFGEVGKYQKETDLGNHEYRVRLPEEKLYDMAADARGLRAQAVVQAKQRHPAGLVIQDHVTNLIEKLAKEAGYLGVRNPHSGVVALFYDTDVKTYGNLKDMVARVQDVLDVTAKNLGATITLASGVNHGGTRAFSVSPYEKRQVIITGHNPTAEQIHAYILANADLLADPDHALGTWLRKEDGNTYLDVAIVEKDLGTALRIGQEQNQVSIYDLKNFIELPTGGQGSATAVTVEEAMELIAEAEAKAAVKAAAEQEPQILQRYSVVDSSSLAILAASQKGREAIELLNHMIGTPLDLDIKMFRAEPGGHVGVAKIGQYKSTIELAYNAKDVLSTAAHEGFHFLEAKVLSKADRTIINNALGANTALRAQFLQRVRAYDRTNGTDIEGQLGKQMEVNAYAFEFWRRGELNAPTMLDRVFQKLGQFLERVRNAINGLGFTSIADIWEAIDAGAYAIRQDNAPSLDYPATGTEALNGVIAPDLIPVALYKDVAKDKAKAKKAKKAKPDDKAGRSKKIQGPVSEADGKPFWVKTTGDLVKLRRMIRSLAVEGAVGRDWHDRSSKAFMAWAGGDPIRAELLAKLTANYSPRAQVGSDLGAAIHTIEAFDKDLPLTTIKTMTQLRKGAEAILADKPLTGIKRQNFFRNLMMSVDPVRFSAKKQGATVDMWISHAFMYANNAEGGVSETDYAFANAEVGRLADELGWQIEETQAAIWVAIKARATAVRHEARLYAYSQGWYKDVPAATKKKKKQAKQGDIFDTPPAAEAPAATVDEEIEAAEAAVDEAIDKMVEGDLNDTVAEKMVKQLKKEHVRDFITDWIGRAYATTVTEEQLQKANVSYGESMARFYDTRFAAAISRTLEAPTTVSSVLNDMSPQMILLSKGAVADVLNRAAKGEVPYSQVMMETGKLLDSDALPDSTFREMFGASRSAFGSSLSRWHLDNVASGMLIASKSAGFKNVFDVLTAYRQRKDRLISEGVDVQLSRWRKATAQDTAVVGKALLERTVGGFTKDSPEYQAIFSKLTKEQRMMFTQADIMVATRLEKEFKADMQSMQKILGIGSPALAEWVAKRGQQVERLIAEGYVPERRYGDHTVHIYAPVVSADGKTRNVTMFYEQYESQAEATLRQKQYEQVLAESAPELQVSYGYRYKAEHDASVSYQQFLDTARRQGISLSQGEKERLAKALISADSVRRNRIFRRKNVPGYSQDAMRVLSEFAVGMANKVAYSEFGSAVNDALQGMKVDVKLTSDAPQIAVDEKSRLWDAEGPMSGFYRNLADERVDFVMAPQEGSKVASSLRAAASLHFLGGSLAAGMVQLSSLPMNTVPWLSQHGGYANAFGKVLSGFRTTTANFGTLRDLATLEDLNTQIPDVDAIPGLRQALINAAHDGTTMDTEIYQIMGLTRGGLMSKSRAAQKAIEVWMSPFRLTEQINRISTFIAAYKVGQQQKLGGDALYTFAQEAVHNTQFRYDEVNRPGLAQSPWGAVLFTFKSYPLFMMETLSVLFKQRPSAATAMLLSMLVAAGVNGMPFAEDLMDLIDTIAQRIFGAPFNSKRALHNWFKAGSEALVGADLSGVMMNGMVNELTGLNFASRVGLGNLIPGTRIGAADADYSSVMQEVLGPVGSMITGAGRGLVSLSKGEFLAAVKQAGPTAVKNAAKGVEQFATGYAADAQGRKLVDVGTWEAFAQTIGFSPAALSKAYELDRMDKQSLAFYREMQDAFTKAIVDAVRDNDPEAVREAYAAVVEWNAAYPDMRMKVSPTSVRRRVVEAGMPLNQRTLKLLPAQLRGAAMSSESGLDG